MKIWIISLIFLVILGGCSADKELEKQITLDSGEIINLNTSGFKVTGISYLIDIPETWEIIDDEFCDFFAKEISDDLPVLMVTGSEKEYAKDIETFLSVFTEGFKEMDQVAVSENNIISEDIKTLNYSGKAATIEIEDGIAKCIALETKKEYVMLMFMGEKTYFAENEKVINQILDSFNATR
jgi:hypothetical protein